MNSFEKLQKEIKPYICYKVEYRKLCLNLAEKLY